jgi:hypothetical protein
LCVLKTHNKKKKSHLLNMSTLRKNSVAKTAKLPSSPDNSDSDAGSESDVESKHRRKPSKKSRLNVNHLEHLAPLVIADAASDNKASVAVQSKCDECVVKASNNIKLQAKTQEIEKLHQSLQTSYMNIETEILMGYVLFFTIAPYILYSGIKYDNRALLSIGIVLLLYAITNIFMLLWE